MSILLVAGAIVLAAAVWRLTDAASAARKAKDPVKWVYFGRMAYLMTALLLVTLAILAMRGIRWIVARFTPPPPSEPTSQVSAWEEAGKRFELPDDDDDDYFTP